MLSIFEGQAFSRQGYGWHVDLESPLWNETGMQIRYDFNEPHHGVINDQVREVTFGFNYHSHYWNSILYVLGTSRFEEGVGDGHTGALVVWKLSPMTQQ